MFLPYPQKTANLLPILWISFRYKNQITVSFLSKATMKHLYALSVSFGGKCSRTWKISYKTSAELNTDRFTLLPCPWIIHFFLWRCDPTRVMASSFLRFLDYTQRRTTVGRTLLDEWSARRRDLYLTSQNTHNKHPWPRWDSNPWSLQASGRRLTP